ncbi:MAG TPA: acyl-CoA dehydrogenase, partial [Bacillota bacterium]
KEKYLIPYARGEKKSAICISEPWAGSDPRSMRTRAVKKGNKWVINGRKIWISRAKEADFLIVMAVTDPDNPRHSITAFLVDQGTPGLKIARSIPTIGHSQPYEVVFDDVEVDESQVLGEVGKGFAPMQTRLNTRRVQMGGRALGTATRALEMMIEHANRRVTFGVPLAERQAVQFMIADSAMEIESVRWLTYRTAWKVDRGEASFTDAAMVKVLASEMVGRVLDRAIQVHGGMGVSKDLPLEFMYRQARIDRIVEGPSEVHRWAIARDYLKNGVRRVPS